MATQTQTNPVAKRIERKERKAGIIGSTNKMVVDTISSIGNTTGELIQTVETSATIVRKVVDLAEIALDEMKVEMQGDYIITRLELNQRLTDFGINPKDIPALMTMREA